MSMLSPEISDAEIVDSLETLVRAFEEGVKDET